MNLIYRLFPHSYYLTVFNEISGKNISIAFENLQSYALIAVLISKKIHAFKVQQLFFAE